MPSYLDFNEMPNSDAAERDLLSNYNALFTNQPDQPQGYDGVPEWNDISSELLYNLPSPLPEGVNDEISGLFRAIGADQPRQGSPRRSTGQSSPQPANSIQSAGVGVTLDKGAVATRNPRKQNHSCDQCRTAKRACDLPQDSSINGQKPTASCTTCVGRGLKCTVAWLASRKSQQHARKRARTTSYTQSTDTIVDSDGATYPKERATTPPVGHGTFTLSRDEDLARQLVGRNVLSQQFNLYVDVMDMPISHCLLQGSMHPRYSMGIAALMPLSKSSYMSGYFDHANVWIRSSVLRHEPASAQSPKWKLLTAPKRNPIQFRCFLRMSGRRFWS